jgi:hypothetical protein
VTLNEETLDICEYRRFIHQVIAKAKRQLQELFRDELPPELPPLSSLKENFTDRRLGWTFLTLDANRRLEELSSDFLDRVKCKFALSSDSSG